MTTTNQTQTPRDGAQPGPARTTPRTGWPYEHPDPRPMPATLPDGSPWPRISVVTASFNQGKYIEETILSVLNQGYPNVEHIIMDGGSTDDTRDILDRYRDRLACVVSEKDEGQSDAITRGFERTTGDMLTWLNSDDMLAPGALAGVALAMHTSGADMVAGECHVYKNGNLHHRHLTSCADGPLPLDDLLDLDRCWMTGQFFYQPEVMWTRDLWERAGAYVSKDWWWSLDYDLWVRFAEAGARIHVIGRPIALFRAHEEQKTQDTGFVQELPKVVQKFIDRTGHETRPAYDHQPKPTLRVVLFNDIGYKYGAGIAHRRVAEALATAGHDVHAVADEDVKWTTSADVVAAIAAHNPDLVIVGNVHAANLPVSALERIAEQFPTAFLLHDLWMLTGGCAYPSGCTRYLTGCDARCTCPETYPKPAPQELTARWQDKRRLLAMDNAPALLANSRWTKGIVDEVAARDATLRSQSSWIKFGIELDVFRPRDKGTCRDLLGLDRDAFIIMTSASSLADERKGFAHLVDAVKILNLPDLQVIGTGLPQRDQAPPLPNLKLMGYVTDPMHLSMLYAASDLFVGPSVEEAFGQVFVEAAACATPSVGYPVGGVPEAILDSISGRLAETVSAGALASAIGELYHDSALRERMRWTARLWAENEWSMSASINRITAALREAGLEARVGLSRKLNLARSPVRVPEPVQAAHAPPFWTTRDGFGGWEGPLPEVKLDHFRWALGPVSRLRVHASRGGRHVVALRVRNFFKGQRLRVLINGEQRWEDAVPQTGHADEHLVRIETPLEPGANEVELHHWRWQHAEGARPIALLVIGIHAVRTDEL